MKNSVKQFFSDVKETSVILWYMLRFLIYLSFIYISFGLMSIASTIGNVLGLLLICSVVIIGSIRSFRVIKELMKKFGR